jgi:adenosine deaminase
MSALGEFSARLPKAELHLHLEGAVSPELFAHLRDKYEVPSLEGGYVEMFFSPAAHETVIGYKSMVAGMHAARKEFGLLARLIPAHNRELGLDRGMAFLDTVLNYRPPKVIGIGLDYAERPHPPAGLFATTLNREYTLAAEAFGLSQATLGEIAANGLNHGWSPRSAALAADERR